MQTQSVVDTILYKDKKMSLVSALSQLLRHLTHLITLKNAHRIRLEAQNKYFNRYKEKSRVEGKIS